MAKYEYKDIIDLLKACGFVPEKNNNGSHQSYIHPASGISVDVPKHAKGVSSGVGKKLIVTATFVARLTNTNIASDKYNLSNTIVEEIKKVHKKWKEHFIFVVPEEIRTQAGIKTNDEAKLFLKDKIKQVNEWYQKNYKSSSKNTDDGKNA